MHIHAHTTASAQCVRLLYICEGIASFLLCRWTYPVLLVHFSSDEGGLYSIFDHLTDGHMMPSVSTKEYNATIRLDEEINSLVLQISSASTEQRDRLLNHYSSFDHIKSIYLLGKSPQDSEERNNFFITFHKVCLFCEDERQLAVRWALEMANEYRIRGTKIAKDGDIDDCKSYFQRAVALYDRVAKFIDETK